MCHGVEITPDHLPPHIAAEEAVPVADNSQLDEKAMILETLKRYRGNRSKAAMELGMHRSTLWRKMKTLGIVQ
jgi:transcriptional regulator of acetoin/glycerol metabolism